MTERPNSRAKDILGYTLMSVAVVVIVVAAIGWKSLYWLIPLLIAMYFVRVWIRSKRGRHPS